jgi:hypothetical protein
MSNGRFGSTMRVPWFVLLLALPTLGLAIPSVTISRPTAGGTIGADVDIQFTLSGGSGQMNWTVEVKSVNQGIDYTVVASGTATNVTVRTTWESAGGAFPDDTDYEIRIQATDMIPQTGEASVTGMVLNNTTFIRLTHPTDKATVGGLVRGTGSAGGNWSIRWDDTTVAATGSAGTITRDLDSTKIADGNHTVVLAVTNTYGDTSRITHSITIKNDVLPVVRLTEPTEGDYVKGTVTILGEAHHPEAGSRVTLKTDLGTTLYDEVGADHDIDVDWDTLTSTEGLRTLTLLLTDPSDNENRAIVNVTIDNVAPTVSFSVTPTTGGFGKGTLDIQGEVLGEESGNVDRWRITVDGGTSGIDPSEGDTATISATWNTAIYSDTPHTVKVTAYDKAGNKGEAQVTITTDNTNPTATITSPEAGTKVTGGTMAIAGSVDDANFKEWKLTVDGGTTGLTPSQGTVKTVSATLNTSSYGEGDHEIMLSAYDKAGNKGDATVTFSIDKTKPEITIDAPEENGHVRGLATISGTFTETVDWVVLIDGTVDIPDNTGQADTFSVTWDTRVRVGGQRKFPDGIHTILVRATDLAGNIASTEIPVTVDNTAPTLENILPEEDSFVGETVIITASIKEPNIDTWKVTVDGEDLPSNEGNSREIEVEWDTTDFSEGTHTIEFLVTDKAGNKAEENVPVYIDRTEPEVYIRYPFKNMVIPPNSMMLIVVDVIDFSEDSIDPDDVSVLLKDSKGNTIAKATKTSDQPLATEDGIRWIGEVNVGKGGGKVSDKYEVEVTVTDKAGNGPVTARKPFYVRF